MSSHRPARHDGADAEGAPAAFWAPNGAVAAGPGGDAPRGAVPKMGVRARVAEWPPRRDNATVAAKDAGAGREANREGRGFPGGQQPSAGVPGLKALHRLARRRSKDVEFQEGWPRSPARGLAPLRHRSSSEVTLKHSNYFGVDDKLGPVAVSIRREKLEEHKEHGPQYQHRLIFRTSQLVTLRGSILEDATPTTSKPGTVRGLPLRDTLEYVIPELNIHCLRLALSTPKVTEQLLKLDEQGLCRRHKVGILYCKAGQSSEEEMYNNEEAGPALEEFLALLGEKVSLKSFSKYAAQLDTKSE
ncbi:signal-induced proliferation-associated 1-like protein 3 [Empidonax traillii]|uniref:signal-induced proliferation-associated 1-like protein 3 n=1 Tax=Empidonax traillii TaxID=164674 RepID=UPI000FFD15C0|nr:signal-induced proliferation-associated 1-like protein 3 [Empidonax traillii]